MESKKCKDILKISVNKDKIVIVLHEQVSAGCTLGSSHKIVIIYGVRTVSTKVDRCK